MTTHTHESTWVRIPSPAPDAGLRIAFCPQAGSSAGSFSHLAAKLAPEVESLAIQYPGRQDRRGEPGLRDVHELAEHVAAELLPWTDRPLAVLGHSMGAAISFEATRRLEERGATVERLFTSGRPAPGAGLGIPPPADDAAIVAELRRTDSVPARLLERPTYREAIVSVLRNDFYANTTYQAVPGTKVRAPITLLLSEQDPYIAAADVPAWQQHTTGSFRLARLPGGHSFLAEHPDAVLSEIRSDLG